jgi:hypothetical protein
MEHTRAPMESETHRLNGFEVLAQSSTADAGGDGTMKSPGGDRLGHQPGRHEHLAGPRGHDRGRPGSHAPGGHSRRARGCDRLGCSLSSRRRRQARTVLREPERLRTDPGPRRALLHRRSHLRCLFDDEVGGQRTAVTSDRRGDDIDGKLDGLGRGTSHSADIRYGLPARDAVHR